MDNVGDWLYIVFLVIAGISSLLGSKDKKKKKSRPEILGQPNEEAMSNEPKSKDKGFWEILEDMQKEIEKPTHIPQSKKKGKKSQVAEAAPIPQPTPFLTAEDHRPNFADLHSTTKIQSFEEDSGVMPEETFKDMGELRKAIICSEILNRKY